MTSRWLPSLNVPIAVNCCDAPTAIVVLEGLTAIDSKDAGATVKFVCALWAPNIAVIDVVPAPAVVATPCAPEALLITATDGCEDPHVTVVVRSWVLPSE